MLQASFQPLVSMSPGWPVVLQLCCARGVLSTELVQLSWQLFGKLHTHFAGCSAQGLWGVGLTLSFKWLEPQ
jgi:hypothetical protein